jgi:2'-hydroxyisoflavone reductase
MAALDDRVGWYLFISSHAVYVRDGVGPGSTEDTPRRPPVRDVDDPEQLTDDTYGPCKVACEDDVVARYGDRATIVRPGKVAGPHDPQPGLVYWVRRAARGGTVALPGRPEQPVQVIDSRDLARLVIRLLLDDRPGAFHAVGPARPTTMDELIHTCARVAGTTVEVVPVAPLPFFPLVRATAGWPAMQRDPAKAHAAGMPATSIEVTCADVLAWDRDRGEPPLEVDLSPQEEARLLAAAPSSPRGDASAP